MRFVAHMQVSKSATELLVRIKIAIEASCARRGEINETGPSVWLGFRAWESNVRLATWTYIKADGGSLNSAICEIPSGYPTLLEATEYFCEHADETVDLIKQQLMLKVMGDL